MAHFLMIILASCFVNSLFTEAGPVFNNRKGFLKSLAGRTMMFTGYYRPPLNRATNVYTQGNTVSGGTYFDKVDMQYPQPGFENEQPEVHDEDKNLDENPETNQKDYTEEPTYEVTEIPKKPQPPKRKLPPKRKVPVEEEEEEEDDDYEDYPPYIPSKGNRKNGYFLPSNTFFPMIFSFPGSSSRSGTSGADAGAITAVANSYSTSKGGVASSVATAYGGPPEGVKRRRKTTS